MVVSEYFEPVGTARGCGLQAVNLGDGIIQRAASGGKYGEVGLICLRQLWVALAFVDTRRHWQSALEYSSDTFRLVIVHR